MGTVLRRGDDPVPLKMLVGLSSPRHAKDEGVWRRVCALFHPHLGWMRFTGALSILSVGLSAASPLLLNHVLNVALPQHRVRLLSLLCGAMIGAAILSAAIGVVQATVTNRVGQSIVHELRMRIFDSVQSLELEFFASDASSEVQTRIISDLGRVNQFLTYTAQGILTNSISLATTAAVLIWLNWPIAFASLAIAWLLSRWNQTFSQKRTTYARRSQEEVTHVLRIVQEELSFAGVVLGRTTCQVGTQRARFKDASTNLSSTIYAQRIAGRTTVGVISMTMAALPAMVYWLSGTVLQQISLGTAVVIATMQMRLLGPIQYMLGLNGTMKSVQVMFERVFEYIDLAPASGRIQSLPQESKQVEAPVALGASHLSYSYSGCARAALRDISLDFPPNSLTVITGPSGSGKTTLALILSGLVEPRSGQITLGGSEAEAQRLRQSVVLLSQEAELRNESIRSNVMFGNPLAVREEVDAAIIAAQLGSVVCDLPEGLETSAGERGMRLSGGQRQRVAMARAFLTPHQILIMDEPTSAVDGLTSDEIYRTLCTWSQSHTVILITHRLPRLQPDERVVVLDAGGVAAEAAGQDLMFSGLDRLGFHDKIASRDHSGRVPAADRVAEKALNANLSCE